MNKRLFWPLFFALTFFSTTTLFAQSGPEFWIFSTSNDPSLLRPSLCLHSAWHSSQPSDQQSVNASQIIFNALSVIQTKHEALIENVKAWHKEPNSNPPQFKQLKEALKEDAPNMRATLKDAQEQILSLLSSAQREQFDKNFRDCAKETSSL